MKTGSVIGDCPLCLKEKSMSNAHDQPEKNIGPMGCVAKTPSIFDEIGKIPIEQMDPTLFRTLHVRGDKYGEYGVMATCAQRIKEAMGPRAHLSAAQRESLDLIATKIARIVCGNPNDPDHWLDIEGYAKLARDRIAPAPQGYAPNPATP